MADSFIQVAPDSTGKMMQTYLNTIGGNSVHSEAVALVDTSGNPITTLNVNIGSSINANFIGTVNVASSNASNFNATVSQGGTWNIGTITTLPSNSTFDQTKVLGATINTNTGNSGAGTQRVVIASDQPNIPVTDAGGSLTVDGTVAATQSGTWNIGTITTVPNITITALQGSANLFNTQVAATNVAGTLIAARATRRSVTIRNLDASNSGYIGLAVVTGSNGMLIQPKESMTTDFVGLIQVIMSSGTANFAAMETYGP